jgi:hypothetical protein
MTDEQHSIEKLNSFLFIRERKTSRDHYTSDMMFSSFCFVLQLNSTTTTTSIIVFIDYIWIKSTYLSYPG